MTRLNSGDAAYSILVILFFFFFFCYFCFSVITFVCIYVALYDPVYDMETIPCLSYLLLNEPRCEKTTLRGFGLHSHRLFKGLKCQI